MGTGPRYRVGFRRKRKGKTDYRSRIKLLLSGRPRLVVRRTLRRFITQIVEYSEEGDTVVASCDSTDLQDFGWKGGNANMPAAYLTGLLCGRRAIEKGVKGCVLDLGLIKPLAGSSMFSVLNGAIDAGLAIPHNDESLPHEDRLRGMHIANYAALVKSDKKRSIFSEYKKRGLDPKDLPKHFDMVKNNILKTGKEIKTKRTKKKRSVKGRSPGS
ncbi:MAG: 50S ribosomal protein L18 [Candidatus Hydrothermarchaeaceae archaeon]